MSFLPYVLFGLVTLIAGMQVWALWRARARQGTAAPDFGELMPAGATGDRFLLYFYGERCGPCRALAPLVDRLASQFPNVIKVDVAQWPEVARGFGIMGTPTFVLVEQGRIARVILGGASERALTDLLHGGG